MRRPTLATSLVAAALFGAIAMPASADLRRLSVTLETGETVTVTVDVPPGAPLDSIALPPLPAPAQAIVDLGPADTPTPAPTPTTAPTAEPTPTATASPAPAQTPTATPAPTATPDRSRARGNIGAERAPRSGGDTGRVGGNGASGTGRLDAPATRPRSRARTRVTPPRTRRRDGAPTLENPTVSVTTPGPARIGVPNFFIDKFRIPPFLLPIYQAAGTEYGIRWEVLAAINEIETDYGRNLNVSSAGALGWMQFMPATWEAYGVDGNRDGVADPYNPVDAIFAAARYLRAAGADRDLRAAIFAYNHADWYVDSVLLRARLIGGLPADLVGSLSGLTQGRFPVQARARYAKQVRRTDLARDTGTPAYVVESDGRRRGIDVYARAGARVVAVQDGRIVRTGRSRRLGRYVVLQDAFGNTYTYARLKSVAARYPAPREGRVARRPAARELRPREQDAAPRRPASRTTAAEARRRRAMRARPARTPRAAPTKERLYANPDRPGAARGAAASAPGRPEDLGSYLRRVYGLDRDAVDLKPLVRGAQVTAGTVLGRLGRVSRRRAPHLRFEIRPAGRGAPRIDPKPILDGWKLLESTAIYRAAGADPFAAGTGSTPASVGQILLMPKEALAERVLANPGITIYGCGRRDIRTGQIDRRVLATLEFLVASGLKPTVTSLRCGHSYLTASGNVSEHTTGTAVDIAAVNGVPVLGHQGPGSITELAVQRLLTLQGTMKPHQIITLMTFPGTDNTLALADHDDHIHVGFRPLYGSNPTASRQVDAILEPQQWIKLIDRLERIDNPKVARKPSRYAVDARRRGSRAHQGE